MKGRKHDLNYPFDPHAVSAPACWLPPEVMREALASAGIVRGGAAAIRAASRRPGPL